MASKVYRYKGQRILECAWAGDPHGGRWYVQAYHHTGVTWADEATPHHRTLAEAREYIDLTGVATPTCPECEHDLHDGATTCPTCTASDYLEDR